MSKKSPEGDYSAPPAEIDGQLSFEDIKPAERSVAVPISVKPSFSPPVSARRQVNTGLAEAHQEFDRLDAQGIQTTQAIRQEVGEAALSGDDIERVAVEKAKKVVNSSPKRPKPRRSGFGHKADMGDGDKRVEAQYGKRGEY